MSFIFPLQRGQVSMSRLSPRRINWRHGMYLQRWVAARGGASLSGGSERYAGASVSAATASGGGGGTTNGLHLAWGAKYPAVVAIARIEC
jgi:hypothetical protein